MENDDSTNTNYTNNKNNKGKKATGKQKKNPNKNQQKVQRKPITKFFIKQLYFSLDEPLKQKFIDQLYQIVKVYTFYQLSEKIIQYIQQQLKSNNDDTIYQIIGNNLTLNLKRMIKYSINKKFIFGYINVLDLKFQNLKPYLKLDKLYQYTNMIPYDCLSKYIKAFRLKIGQKQAFTFAQEMLQTNSLIDDAIIIIQSSQDPSSILDKLIKEYLGKQSVGKEYNQIFKSLGKSAKKNGLNLKDSYPQLCTRLQIPAITYYVNQLGWEYLQQICLYKLDLLSYGVDFLVQKGDKIDEAANIVKRNQKVFELLKNKNIIQRVLQQKQFPLIQNPLQNNIFAPSQNHFLSLKDLGIQRQNVIWIDSKTSKQLLNEIFKIMHQTKVIAIDTQSIVLKTGLQNDNDLICLIQIAIKDKVLLLDAFELINQKNQDKQSIIFIKEQFWNFFSKKDNIVVGHALQNDFNLFKQVLKIKKTQKITNKLINKDLIDCQVIQIKTKYSKLTDMYKGKPSLAKLCQGIFKKQLCKKYTMTNWQRRPLLENQIHYAALDAYAVFQLYRLANEQT